MEVKNILNEHLGSNPLLVHFIFPDNKAKVRTVSSDLKVKPSDEVIDKIKSLLGEDSIYLE